MSCDWCFLTVIRVGFCYFEMLGGITFTGAQFPADISVFLFLGRRSICAQNTPVIRAVISPSLHLWSLSFSAGCVCFAAPALFDKGLFDIFLTPFITMKYVLAKVSCIFELSCCEVCVFLQWLPIIKSILTSEVGGCKNRKCPSREGALHHKSPLPDWTALFIKMREYIHF